MQELNSIETLNLRIRPFTKADLPKYTEFMLNPDATRYLNFTPEGKTEAGARQSLEFVLESYGSDHPICALAIATKETDEFIGSCGLTALEADGVCECYYSLLPDYWGRGYATEAMGALLADVFGESEVNEVVALIHDDNRSGTALAERLGMKLKGLSDYTDTGLTIKKYSLCRDEYLSLLE